MDSPVRQYLKQKDYQRHKLFRKMKRRKKAEQLLAIDAPIKELRRRLKRFGDGKDKYYYQTTNKESGLTYNIHPSAFDAKELEVTLPETEIVSPRKYEYRSAFDGNQEYLGDMISLTPFVGDAYDAYNAIQDARRGNYNSAAILAASAIIPGSLSKLAKGFGKQLYKLNSKYEIVPRLIMHDVIKDPKRVAQEWLSGNYAFTDKGRSKILNRDNELLNLLAQDIKSIITRRQLQLREKRILFMKSKGVDVDILTDTPNKFGIEYRYDPEMGGKILGSSGDDITMRYYENPKNSFFKYNWADVDLNNPGLNYVMGHEFTHTLEGDVHFAPFFKTSSSYPGKTNYFVPNQYIEKIPTNLYELTSIMSFPEIQSLFSPTILRYNDNLRTLSEAERLGIRPLFNNHPWYSSPAEVVADLNGAIAAGFDEQKIYDLMWNRHRYDGNRVYELIQAGFNSGKDRSIHIKPKNRKTK